MHGQAVVVRRRAVGRRLWAAGRDAEIRMQLATLRERGGGGHMYGTDVSAYHGSKAQEQGRGRCRRHTPGVQSRVVARHVTGSRTGSHYPVHGAAGLW